MKLAEALILRSDLQKRMEQLRQRLNDNALVQEGEQPAESPAHLLHELESISTQLIDLISKINLTNATAEHSGKKLTTLLAQRDILTVRVDILRNLLETASHRVMRSSRSEVKICSTVDVPYQRRQLDLLSQQLRILDTNIQAANWVVDLKE